MLQADPEFNEPKKSDSYELDYTTLNNMVFKVHHQIKYEKIDKNTYSYDFDCLKKFSDIHLFPYLIFQSSDLKASSNFFSKI